MVSKNVDNHQKINDHTSHFIHSTTHIQDEVQDEVILREENVRALHLEDNIPQADLLLGRHLLRHIHGWVILRLELDLDSLAIYIQYT